MPLHCMEEDLGSVTERMKRLLGACSAGIEEVMYSSDLL